MSNVDPDLDETSIDEDHLKDLRRKAKDADKLTGDNALLTRRAVFAEAGIPSGTKIATLFRESYKGELSEEAVKAAWGELQGELGGSADEPFVDHQVQVEEMAQSRGGGDVVNPAEAPAKDKQKEAWDAYQAQRAMGRSNAAASAELSSRIIDGAIKGEKWAQVQPWSEEQMREARTQIG